MLSPPSNLFEFARAAGHTRTFRELFELQRTHDLPLLAKPHDPDGLLRAIRNQLDKQ